MFRKSFAMLVVVAVMLTFAWYANHAEADYVKKGLLAYWSFDKDTIDGKTVKDSSGNNKHAESNFELKIVPGKIGDALEFGVNGEYLDTKLMITEAQFESLTMMAWAKPSKVHDAWGSVMNCDDGGWDRGYGYRADSWEVQVGRGGDWQPGEVADIDKWQHTVVIYTPDNVIFYKDGERFEFGERTTPTTSVNTLIIGDDIPCGPDCSFPGVIDEVLIYDRALTDAEVKQNYESEGASVEPHAKLALTWGEVKTSR